MATPDHGPAGPVSLSTLLDGALRHLTPQSGASVPGDGFLYSGNRHESVPRALFLDKRLTPLERNAWQVFRLLLNEDGVTAFPTYDHLRPYLSSMPCSARASHETVARALTLLRLTRWLSLARRRRDPNTGRIKGNLYVLHDEPLSPYEAMQIDPEYLGLVSQALTHASKAIQLVGIQTLKEIAEDPLLGDRTLPTRLQVLAQRMARSNANPSDSYPHEAPAHESEDGDDTSLRNRAPQSSESEASEKPGQTAPLRNPKQDRTVRGTRMNQSVRTVPRTRELQNLRLPDRFRTLKSEQQSGAMVALQQVDAEQRQAVLDEWAARCCDSTVRNPAGYLFGIIQKAIRGEFKAWAGQSEPKGPAPPRPHDAEPRPEFKRADPEIVQAHLTRLRSLLDSKS